MLNGTAEVDSALAMGYRALHQSSAAHENFSNLVSSMAGDSEDMPPPLVDLSPRKEMPELAIQVLRTLYKNSPINSAQLEMIRQITGLDWSTLIFTIGTFVANPTKESTALQWLPVLAAMILDE